MADHRFSLGMLAGGCLFEFGIVLADQNGWVHFTAKGYATMFFIGVAIYVFDVICARSSAGSERRTSNPQVAGSNPAERATHPQDRP